MNLSNLKPAWRQYRLMNSMQSMDQVEVLSILDRAEEIAVSTAHNYLINAAMFMVLTLFCQGG
ncbi:MAG: hypothetical protein R2820_14145 [Cyclobacteriaceae bacterium]